MKILGTGNFILQDLESGMFMQCHGFRCITLYTKSEDRAMRFESRQQAEDYLLEKGLSAQFVCIPKTSNQNLFSHA